MKKRSLVELKERVERLDIAPLACVDQTFFIDR